jgi:hypothetical protein
LAANEVAGEEAGAQSRLKEVATGWFEGQRWPVNVEVHDGG